MALARKLGQLRLRLPRIGLMLPRRASPVALPDQVAAPPATTPRIATTIMTTNSGIVTPTDGSRVLNGSNDTVTKCRLATAKTTNSRPSGITIRAVKNFRMASLA